MPYGIYFMQTTPLFKVRSFTDIRPGKSQSSQILEIGTFIDKAMINNINTKHAFGINSGLTVDRPNATCIGHVNKITFTAIQLNL